MNKTIIFLVIGLFCSWGLAFADTWHIETVDEEGSVGLCTSIALDSLDNPHISYYDENNGNLKYYHWNGSSSEIQTVDSTGNVGESNSIALDSSDNPHISYYDCINGLKYAYRASSIWHIQVVDAGVFACECTSIALDSSDNPHISYYDYANGLKYAHWTGSAWEIQIVDTVGIGTVDSSIALDSSNNPHISYCDYDDGYLKYAYWTGSTWEIQSVDTSESVGYMSSIALDSSNSPHISYYDHSNGNLKYAWYEPNPDVNLLSFTATPQEGSSVLLNWQVETTEGEQIAGFNLYRRDINNDIAAEVSNLGCIWTQVNSSLITGQNPYTYANSAVEPGKYYEYKLEAVLTDQSAQTLGTTQAATAQPTTFGILSLYPNPASDVLNIALTLPQSGEVTLELYDLTGRVVSSKNIQISSPGDFTDQLDVRGLANGVYTLRANQNSSEVVAKLVICK